MFKLDFHKTFNISRKILKTMGLRPYYTSFDDNIREYVIHNWWYLLCVGELCMCITLEMIYLFDVWGLENLTSMSYVAPCIMYSVVGLLKVNAVSSNRKHFSELLEDLNIMWPVQYRNDTERETVNNYMKAAKYISWVYCISFGVVILLFNLAPAVEMTYNYITYGYTEKSLPYLVWTPFDIYTPVMFPIMYPRP